MTAGSRFEKHRAERRDRNARKENQTPGKHEEQSILKTSNILLHREKYKAFLQGFGVVGIFFP